MIDQMDLNLVWLAAGMLLVFGFFLNRIPVWAIGSQRRLDPCDIQVQRAGIVLMSFSVLTGCSLGYVETLL